LRWSLEFESLVGFLDRSLGWSVGVLDGLLGRFLGGPKT
jgi:hypothetical protein